MAYFSPFKKLATNVTLMLAEAAKDRKISPQEVDFDILKIETLVKTPKHVEWTIIEEPLEKLFPKKLICSMLLEIRQEYTLKVRATETNPLFENVQIEILSNKTKSKAIAIFKKGSRFPSTTNLAKKIKTEIYRRKLRLGYIVTQYERGLNSAIIKFAKTVVANEALKEDVKIPISIATPPILPIDSSVIFHYKNKPQTDKSLIVGIDPDDLVFEYIKPKKGKNGRGCDGNFIEVREPKPTQIHYAPDPDTIKIIEDENSVKYYAKRDGYFKNDNGLIKISQEIALRAASFKKTGSINTNNNQEISLKIKKNHSNNDAVGSGVNINVKEVNIEGTVGSSSSIKAVKVNIEKQTHRDSQIEAQEHAKVRLHRGQLKTKTAQIDILENGTVEAEEVSVGKMLGGKIIAKRVTVNELTSNATIIASELIEIGSISGEHNKLIIDPNQVESHTEEVALLEDEIKEFKTTLKTMQKELEKRIISHQELIPRIQTFKKRMLLASKEGKTPSKQDIIRIKQYKRDGEKLQDEQNKIKLKTEELQAIQERHTLLNEPELQAKIIHKGLYNGHTKIKFIDSKTDEKYSMLPTGEYKTLLLTKTNDEKKITWIN